MTTALTALPESRVPDPRDAPPVRWGILGPGWIASQFAAALRRHTRQELAAVASRSPERAAAFAAEYGIPRAYGSYAELVGDPDVDIVYVATPHSEHHRQALMAIEAGKSVLVEKAFTRTAAEAAEVAAAAGKAGVFAMEAMWTRFLPHIDVLRQLVTDGHLGEVMVVTADHGQYFAPDPHHRLYAPELAGGALLDLGIYPISFAAMVLGASPDEVTSTGSLAFTGVDAQSAVTLRYGDAVAQVGTTLLARTPTVAAVSGTVARVELAADFYTPTELTYVHRDGARLVRPDGDTIRGHEGLCYQAAHAATLITEGATESPLLPLAETTAILAIIDEIRTHLGAP
ncbi:MAG: hypothetical protein QOI35_1847 [Cryptosporangiaceae bacterium]|nr:hypothetical protein [Cryptosporangiaceae bacterium]